MDPIGWAIANLHSMLGHDKAAMVLGVPAGDKDACVICRFERDPTGENRAAVYDALRPDRLYTPAGDPAVGSTRFREKAPDG